MLHYKRARAGRPLVDGPEVGSPDGHGRYGILDDDGDRVMCHECGRWYANLAAHAAVHGLSARQYKLRHGLPLSRSLSPSKLREARSRAASDRVGSQGWQRLEKARNPARAAQARDPESFVSPYATYRHREYSPSLLPAWQPRIITCVICGAQYCPLPGTGRPRRTCSEECLKITHTQGLRHHP